MSAVEQEVLPIEQPLECFKPFVAELAKMEAENKALVFDYTSLKGVAAAKSHIYKLRKTKKPVDDARSRAKADALAFIRNLDGQRNEIIAKIDAMIEVHEAPIREAEEREAQRVAEHRQIIEYIASLNAVPGMSSQDIGKLCGYLSAVVVDESLEEFRDEAAILYTQKSADLQVAYAAAVKREQEEAELAQLRAEKAARDQRDREEAITREAAEKARLETEARVQAEREAAEARERAEKARAERAEAEAQAAIKNAARAQREAEERAAEAAREAEARVRREAEQQAEQERQAQAKREADVAHKAEVNRNAVAALVHHACINEADARAVVTAIARGLVANISIRY